jgi:hypothetical protein
MSLETVSGYTPSDQGLPISSEGARECLHRTMALEGSREGRGEAVCSVLYSCKAYVTSQHDRVSEVRHRHSLVRRVMRESQRMALCKGWVRV